jgi:hypothetical protein
MTPRLWCDDLDRAANLASIPDGRPGARAQFLVALWCRNQDARSVDDTSITHQIGGWREDSVALAECPLAVIARRMDHDPEAVRLRHRMGLRIRANTVAMAERARHRRRSRSALAAKTSAASLTFPLGYR